MGVGGARAATGEKLWLPWLVRGELTLTSVYRDLKMRYLARNSLEAQPLTTPAEGSWPHKDHEAHRRSLHRKAYGFTVAEGSTP